MQKTKQTFYCFGEIRHAFLCSMLIVLSALGDSSAAVVSRGATTVSARPTVSSRMNTTSRLPTSTATAPTSSTSEQPAEVETDATEEEPVIENKSSQFDSILSESSVSTSDSSADNLAALIQQQRAELDAQDAIDTAANSVKIGNSNACDVGLRSCMQEKCGADFTDCSGDTDTIWGDKMDSCRLSLDCTGEEYRLFSTEIKADRDMNAQLASYNAILNCGNEYNDCIMTECGVTFSKCLGKTAGDAAIAKCKQIADDCVQQDSGLASRAMQVFANLRQDAEEQVQKDEQRLYELRDQMSQQCTMLGAMFDERTFSCVFTVNFYAGDDSTLYASKKLYAGNVFSCTPDWFGIDVTTFMENAYRLTREQTSASSALLGSGLGVAAGAITSGAINRAIDTQKAENALNDAKEEAKSATSSTNSDASSNSTKGDSDEGDKNNGNEQTNAPSDADTKTETSSSQTNDTSSTNRGVTSRSR